MKRGLRCAGLGVFFGTLAGLTSLGVAQAVGKVMMPTDVSAFWVLLLTLAPVFFVGLMLLMMALLLPRKHDRWQGSLAIDGAVLLYAVSWVASPVGWTIVHGRFFLAA